MPGVSGAVNATGKAPVWSAGSTPPLHSSTVLPAPSGVAVAVHPSTGSATASANGARMRTATVGDSPHPWVGCSVTVAAPPAGTATTSLSVCAAAGEPATRKATAKPIIVPVVLIAFMVVAPPFRWFPGGRYRPPARVYRRDMRITGIDHVVFNVSDVERSLAWWRDLLGLEPVRLDEWRRGEAPFVSVRVSTGTILDLFQLERSGENVDHVALQVDDADLDELAADDRFDVVRGPLEVFGARGVGRGLYVRDPDGNVIELRTYGP